MNSLIPEFLDEVKNINSGTCGTVDANYSENGVDYIDVIVGEHMYCRMLQSNWEVVTKYKE